MTLAHRVAAQAKRAAFFNPGDLILYGKYKNKKGRIVSFSLNDKGQPLVEIEPIPKGRKQNKVLGLFKIWNLAVAEAAMKEKAVTQVTAAINVASRFKIVAMGIPLGKTWETDSIRVHRYRDVFEITDLTNAGKRGKKVRILRTSPSYSYKGDRSAWFDSMAKAIPDYDSFDRVVSLFKDVLVDNPGEINMDFTEVRGVDVQPYTGKTNLTLDNLKTTGLRIEVKPYEFRVLSQSWHENPSKTNRFVQDTNYWSQGKESAAVFYNWVVANVGTAAKLDLPHLLKLWDELGVKWNSH